MKRAFTIIRVSEEDRRKSYGPDVQSAEIGSYLSETGLTEVARRFI